MAADRRRPALQRRRRRSGTFLLYCGLLLGLTPAMLASTPAHPPPREAPSYFRQQAWSTEDGLPQASVHALLQSHDGFLWIATEDGAARFDGQAFRVLNHALVPEFTSNDVSCLAEDHAGDIWFGTSDGLVRKHDQEYRHFSQHDGLPSDEIVALAAVRGELFVLTAGGPARWDSDRFVAIETNQTITGLADTEPGPALVSNKGGLYRWSNAQLLPLAAPAQEAAAVLGAATGPGQAVWTYGSNFVQLSSPSERKIWQVGRDLPGSRVQTIYVDPQGKAWIGTNRGLVSIDASPGSTVQPYAPLRGESILSALVDREGDLWVGTEASGLHAFEPRKFATVPGSNSEAVTTVLRDSKDGMYFGTRDDGIFRMDGAAVPVAANKLTSPVILSLAAGPNGDIWAGTPDGLNHIEGTNVRHWTIADGLPDNFVRSVIVSGDSTVWAGTRFGLVHIDRNAVQTFTTSDGLASDSIGPLLDVGSKQSAARVLWVGTSAGLCRQSAHRFRCVSSPYPNSIITALAADHNGDIWVALHGHGLGVVNYHRILAVSVPSIPAEIVGILADDLGNVWLRSTRGLYRVKANDLRACATNSSACNSLVVDAYGRTDGMQSDEVAGEGIPDLGEGSTGELWFATRRGIAVTDAQHLLANHVPPGVVITQAQVDGVELPEGTIPEIKPGHRQYTFEYAGLSLNNAAATRCRYMLDGFDRGWIDAGPRRAAFYTNLPPRQYTFKVMCANSDGLWSTNQAEFGFQVLRPWYRSLWIYLLALCLAALAVFAVVQLRVRAERRHFALLLQERTRVAREVHDTLAQDLVSVSLQVEMAAQHARAGRLSEVSEQLTQTRSLVRQALESARQSIWNLRANLSQETLPARLTARVEALAQKDISARLRIGGEYRSASPTIENEVMRIAMEAISNAERHSRATEIAVELSYGPDTLRLKVQDNGCGFDLQSARAMADHYGLKGLDERAALLQAHLSVESAVGKGTTVTLITPLAMEK